MMGAVVQVKPMDVRGVMLCEVIGAFGCLQTNTALPQLCNISRVSAEISCY